MEKREINFIKSLAKSFKSTLPILDKTITCIDNKVILGDLETFVTFNKKLWPEGIYNIDGTLTFDNIGVDEYPNLPGNPITKIGILPVNNLIANFIPYCIKDDLRPVLECIYFDSENMVATNASRLRFDKHNMKLKSDFLLHVKPAKILTRLIKFYKQSVTIKENSKHLFFICPEFMMTVRKIDGNYPNYKGVLPDVKEYTTKLVFPINEITEEHKAQKKHNKVFTYLKFDLDDKECFLTDGSTINKIWKLKVIEGTLKSYNRLLMPVTSLNINIANVNVLKTDTLYMNPGNLSRSFVI